MKIERDERKFDFHGIGLAIKKAREREGMTQEQLGYIVDRDPRTIMYHENDGQHPSLNAFYQMVTMFGISVDEYFYPDMGADEAAKKRINIQLNSLNESELRLVEGIIHTIIWFISSCMTIALNESGRIRTATLKNSPDTVRCCLRISACIWKWRLLCSFTMCSATAGAAPIGPPRESVLSPR